MHVCGHIVQILIHEATSLYSTALAYLIVDLPTGMLILFMKTSGRGSVTLKDGHAPGGAKFEKMQLQ